MDRNVEKMVAGRIQSPKSVIKPDATENHETLRLVPENVEKILWGVPIDIQDHWIIVVVE
ncbi:hypothetical protein HZA56_05230 [Candidatus Poribacteria bacterium]|nr:hypothetical protein [Candidatus Poribacteria bacterium]